MHGLNYSNKNAFWSPKKNKTQTNFFKKSKSNLNVNTNLNIKTNLIHLIILQIYIIIVHKNR